MFNVNRITLLGNVTRDPEAKTAKTGTSITSIGLATNRPVKDERGNTVQEAEFHNLVCFGSLADFSGKAVKKGSPLYVEGRIHTSRYQTKDGKDASKTEVVVEKLVLLSSKKGEIAAEGA
ncbi:single-stranded DNA-binding protein [Candidatus Peribacteria bacterium]|nr:MAG: single-stranded DNA-binding protein [Candidatus Peribacteria bacterium]